MNAALNQQGPQWLLNEVRNAPLKYAQKAESNFSLPLGRTFAQVQNCPEATCHLGRKRCNSCMGRGSWLEFQTVNAPNGQTVRQQVQKNCMGCGGLGRESCPTCSGTGHQTRIAQVWIWAGWAPFCHQPCRSSRISGPSGPAA